MPDALTTGTQQGGVTRFPAVPNRWLVTRSRDGTIEGQWVVESDYLYPDGEGRETSHVSYPIAVDPSTRRYRPYRYLGRKMPLAAWDNPVSNAAEYLEEFTAVGYGESAFAAFYPNCHSVFGFHDDELPELNREGLRYDLLDWYAKPDQDPLTILIDALAEANTGTAQALVESIENAFGWTVSFEGDQAGSEMDRGDFPRYMLCFARLNFGAVGDGAASVMPRADLSITVGNTGTEALSAHLATVLDPARKDNVEDRLESLFLSTRLDNRELDSVAIFKQGRHEKGFQASPAGTLWTVRLQSRAHTLAEAETSLAREQLTLPVDTAHQLNALNQLQLEYDRAQQKLASRRRQLFSDWYKYMICVYPPEASREEYPDPDEARYFIEKKVLEPLQQAARDAGTLALQRGANDQVTGAAAVDSTPNCLAAQLATAINALLAVVNTHNNANDVQEAGGAWTFKPVAVPRFWQPTDPVVLIHGEAAKATNRHGQDGRLRADGRLECGMLSGVSETLPLPEQYDLVQAAVTQMEARGTLGFFTWTESPWHPFLLEWEAEVFPLQNQGNLEPVTRAYGPSYIEANYALPENEPDLALRPNMGAVTSAANVYSGSIVLTPYATDSLLERLETWLEKQLLQPYYEAHPDVEQADDYFMQHIQEILNWYEQNTVATVPESDTALMVRAWRHLTTSGVHVLSQALGGFNDALIMHRQVRQVPIADPLGFTEYQAFRQAVAEAVGQSIRSAPEPLNDFNPIRSGVMNISRLRLVDTFGQSVDLDCSKVSATRDMAIAESDDLLRLTPRLSQPARLNFRWLAAASGEIEHGEQEMNDHPATTPICGWLLPNNLDSSLAVYDAAGQALGSVTIDPEQPWQPPPGVINPPTVEAIANPHLRRVIRYLVEQGEAFLNALITALDNALARIEPENFAAHQDLALLMGRPLAVVRASLDLELQGLPEIHHGWNAFRADLRREVRDSAGFTEVHFPIRLGEYGELNDGLAGYWRELGTTYEGNCFYAPQSESVNHALIKTHADDAMTFFQTLSGAPQTFTLLLDPRGVVHATCGILPAKDIHIPPDQYAAALQAINVTFLTAPVLSSSRQVQLPLPEEPGYLWSWLQQRPESWLEVFQQGKISKQVFLDYFDNGVDIWQRLLDITWLVEIDANHAAITPRDRRTTSDPGPQLADERAAIEDLLDRFVIGKVGNTAVFSGTPQLREGWLKLSPETEPGRSA